MLPNVRAPPASSLNPSSKLKVGPSLTRCTVLFVFPFVARLSPLHAKTGVLAPRGAAVPAGQEGGKEHRALVGPSRQAYLGSGMG